MANRVRAAVICHMTMISKNACRYSESQVYAAISKATELLEYTQLELVVKRFVQGRDVRVCEPSNGYSRKFLC